ncbi:uncharacterized protein Z520_08515 [Fonsecaea multimorphosa CBS 102226]|uniref:AB hydrolase-1 domain-containing protein n=1 Tax=Fonsecaea multimorphosa CBS 102226 TaxID=1442371 RepID=A0A0D2JR16_9EURO|nr:uncharacterized protein Z520_08515 [Fonsecaea multimorphosa CBS 102226]KIX95807.1 hypothetical protein Z520_08515 [Fonsecaea multimorphosa CBS 102226]OAL21543.1 hypothetical protein AYO22_07939 [Fonsecaea multimorphosa]
MSAERVRSTVLTKDGINWYYEQEGTGPDLVLIPDGLGDCQMFDKPMSLIASSRFKVTTFDMPGMSRSSAAPPETYQEVTGEKLATYIDTLMDKLDITTASVWGCSSGASTVLALCANFPHRVRNAMPHELPTTNPPSIDNIHEADPATLPAALAATIRTMSGGEAAWDALGPEVHDRLRANNYVRWAYGYPRTIPGSAPTLTTTENLHKVPIDWTVGGAGPMQVFFENVVIAAREKIPITTLPGFHFPYVSHPEVFAKYVVETCRKYL